MVARGGAKESVRKRRSAEHLAKSQREISVSEFFEKNTHLLGFENPLRALMTTVKEGVDNALDACEEAGVLPDVTVEITRAADLAEYEAADPRAFCGFTGEEIVFERSAGNGHEPETTDEIVKRAAALRTGSEKRADGGLFQRGLFDADASLSEDEEAAQVAAEEAASKGKATNGAAKKKGKRGIAAPAETYVVAIQDNGPGIVAAQVAKIFGKLLYGSKFHRLRQSRGQQGIGISAAGMYGQTTTGRPVRILTRTGKKKPANYFEVLLDVKGNKPDVRVQETREWEHERGTRVVIEMKAKYQRGQRSVDAYLASTAVANPHVTLRYRDPDGRWTIYRRASQTLPDEPREVKPHPYGVELGNFLRMLQSSEHKKVGAFLQNEFCRVSRKTADEIANHANVNLTTWLSRVQGDDARKLHAALSKVKIMNPPTDCVSPIGEDLLIESLARDYPEAFLRAVTRSPSVYRGNPFQVEVALAYGKGIPADGSATVLRFANRVPLLYKSNEGAIGKAVNSIPWKKSYGVDQARGAPPSGPLVVVVHVASVWVPFTSESKEAIALIPEIVKEVKLAVQECGRALGRHLKAEKRRADALKKRDYIAKYIPKISEALQGILEFDDKERDVTTEQLVEVLNRSRKL
jgi:DNA topoisomerase-6 subunit B